MLAKHVQRQFVSEYETMRQPRIRRCESGCAHVPKEGRRDAIRQRMQVERKSASALEGVGREALSMGVGVVVADPHVPMAALRGLAGELERSAKALAYDTPDEVQALLEATEQQREIDALRERLMEAEAESEELAALLAQSEETDDREAFIELVRQAARNAGREAQLSALREEAEAAARDRDSMRTALQNCQAQNLNCSQRLQEAGLGYPPCWADASGKPEYIYTVALRGDSLAVRPAWPAHRADDARRVDGALALAGRTLSRQAFAEGADPILRWSQAQTPECRHFVIVDDTGVTTKEAFKESLLLVEGYFYKYLPRN